jgi:hypothetical protein
MERILMVTNQNWKMKKQRQISKKAETENATIQGQKSELNKATIARLKMPSKPYNQ